jgi:hypothetical protein
MGLITQIGIFFLLFCIQLSSFAQDVKTVVYLIPGQGADSRQFDRININERFEVRDIEYFVPEKGWKMHQFAKELALQIDTSERYVIIGVSLGGMLATEMGDFLNPEKIILISSAKCRDELPGRYTFQKTIPLNKLIPAGMMKCGAKFLQPIVEPDSKKERNFFLDMLKDKDPVFLKRTADMIISWERSEFRKDIVHIHGDNDHTIPLRNVKCDYLINDGSHMMVYTRADEISGIINKILMEQMT